MLFDTGEQLATGDTDASIDLYRSEGTGRIPAAHRRYTDMFALVPAYQACTSPDREHGPPLAFPSCSAPAASGHLTIGTPDANGLPAKFTGFVRYDTIKGEPGTVADEADLRFTVVVEDVRLASGLADYEGELELRTAFSRTD